LTCEESVEVCSPSPDVGGIVSRHTDVPLSGPSGKSAQSLFARIGTGSLSGFHWRIGLGECTT